MVTKTLQANSVEEIKSKIFDTISNDFHPSLAIIFSSVQHDLNQLSQIFNDYDIQIVGATTYGEIRDTAVYDFSIVIMLLDIDKSYFSVYLTENINNDIHESTKRASKIAKEKFKNPSFIVISGGITSDGFSIVEGIMSEFETNVPIFGGLAGDDLNMVATYVFTNNTITSNGLIFLIFDNDKIEVNGISSCGWESVGVEKTVTKAVGNVVYEIDNHPAMDVFLKLTELTEDTKENAVLPETGVKFPLQYIRPDRPAVLRAPMLINKIDRSIVFGGRIPQGSKIKFSLPATFEVIEETLKELEDQKSKIPNADAMILFSCGARKLAFGPMIIDEIAGIKKIWNVPLIGFFSYGEIGNLKDDITDFHNETCSLILLREK